MRLKNKYNLTYCLNAFKAKDLQETICNIKKYIEIIKIKKKNCIGLCLSNKIAKEILTNNNIDNIKKLIIEKNIYIPIINGFVYKNFHKEQIKENIYYPEWTSNKRLNFTKKLIKILKEISPKNLTSSITTSPISYKPWIKQKNKTYILYKSIINLQQIIKILIDTKKKTGKTIHIDIEPEPTCLIENSKETIQFFKNWLIPICKNNFKKKIFNKNKIENIIKKHIRICYDTCHFSINFENNKTTLNLFEKEKIKIGRIQISSALKIIQSKKKNLKNFKSEINKLNYSPFLHQTTKKYENKKIQFKDIKYCLENINKNSKAEWRIHCHIPIYLKKYKIFNTTSHETKSIIKYLSKKKITNHIEIETYTYDAILQSSNKAKSIKKEYIWVVENLKNKNSNSRKIK